MRQVITVFLFIVFLAFCGCTVPLTFSSVSIDDLESHRTEIATEDEALPTPQFVMVQADIERGRIVPVRLSQHADWKRHQHRTLPPEVTSETTATKDFKVESDRALQAINTAFKHAQTAPGTATKSPRSQTHP
jgi:hypothetical protein